jgi:hypothetical protein
MVAYSGVPDAIIRCVSRGRSASEQDILNLAKRIWTESAPSRSAFAWGSLDTTSPERRAALRSATVALNGWPAS